MQADKVQVNMTAHNGLRGAAAMWVMLFHLILYSSLALDFQGSSLMPLFFLLSGFSLAVVYGARTVKLPTPCFASLQSPNQQEQELPAFNSHRFYVNRFVRVLPLYYTCSLIAVPLMIAGYTMNNRDYPAMIFSSIQSLLAFFPTLLSFLLGGPLDGPAWTVSTLLCLWLYFPRWIPAAQRMSEQQLVYRLWVCYWGQLLLVVVCFVPLLPSLGFWPAFATATMNPLTRFPVFLMGVYAGVLCSRHPDPSTSTLPWPNTSLALFPHSKPNEASQTAQATLLLGDESSSSECVSQESLKWAATADFYSIFLLALTLGVSTLDALARKLAASPGVLGAVWFQALLPFAQLQVVVALTRDGGASRASRVLTTRLSQWLGQISMSIYLIHFLVMYYLCWAVHGSMLSYPDNMNCDSVAEAQRASCKAAVEVISKAVTLPVWGIPVAAILSLLAAAILHYGVEEPARKALRA
eukprot:TRINITY_DN2090_c0_g1_i1.p1 TRINITY_DN2090_c0_g1~~TRINITY_DN2090_c0_g1_i1.p1  ORF type:complete len:467 (+),score=112.92 TRINITY_DN2090_c0_g1_i1:96-1496(+)